jgi:8-oxo-dGTP diphosphatase
VSATATPSTTRWPRPLVAVDVAAFTVLESDLKVLLIERGLAPRSTALPGGFVRCGDVVVDQGEDLEAAARRELREETRLEDGLIGQVRLRQAGAFGAPDRDPRARVISVGWMALVRPELAAFVRAGSDAAEARWVGVADAGALTLAFDHQRILAACLARELVPRAFTVAELRAVVDAVVGAPSDAANFRRRVRGLVEDGVIVEVAGHRVTARRPAQVYAFAGPPG